MLAGQENKCLGFSLIEALIVLAILAIVGTMTVGNMLAARPHSMLERGEIQLTGFLSQARNAAISREVAARVVFDMATSEYWSETYDRATASWGGASAHQTLPEGVSFNAGGNTFPADTVNFTPRGTLMAGGTITIRSSAGETSALSGNIATGRFSPGGGNLR